MPPFRGMNRGNDFRRVRAHPWHLLKALLRYWNAAVAHSLLAFCANWSQQFAGSTLAQRSGCNDYRRRLVFNFWSRHAGQLREQPSRFS